MSDSDSGTDPDMPHLVKPEVLKGSIRGDPILRSDGTSNTEFNQDSQANAYIDGMAQETVDKGPPDASRDIGRYLTGSAAPDKLVA